MNEKELIESIWNPICDYLNRAEDKIGAVSEIEAILSITSVNIFMMVSGNRPNIARTHVKKFREVCMKIIDEIENIQNKNSLH